MLATYNLEVECARLRYDIDIIQPDTNNLLALSQAFAYFVQIKVNSQHVCMKFIFRTGGILLNAFSHIIQISLKLKWVQTKVTLVCRLKSLLLLTDPSEQYHGGPQLDPVTTEMKELATNAHQDN